MTDAFAQAESTPWLSGKRIRAYNPTLALLALLVPPVAGIPVALVDPVRFWPIAFLGAMAAFFGLIVLGRWSTRGVRVNNGAVALMTRGEDLGASNAFRVVVSGFHGRDVVGVSLHNLGVLALRALDTDSAIALLRAAIAVGGGFRFRWQPNIATDLARPQLAFALAAKNESLDEADALLEAGKAATSPQAIAFAVRARALLAARRGRLEEAVAILDEERALLRNVLPLNDTVLCEAIMSYALLRQGDTYRGATRPHSAVLADAAARSYVRRIMPEAEVVLAEG
jgi:hypothetical protein